MDDWYSNYGYRARLISALPGKAFNWLFLPGGPGLGSEAFGDLADNLALPGKSWYVDYPGDGSNHKDKVDYQKWSEGLLDLVSKFSNVIIVAHSFSGMFVLSQAAIEEKLTALMLINTAPDASWSQQIPQQVALHNLPDLSQQQLIYQKNPSNAAFKQLCRHSAIYFFSKHALKEGQRLLQDLPYSHDSYDWAGAHFHPNYQAQFIPKIPTLIITADCDHITPGSLFKQDKQWQRENIFIKEIPNAGHFAWLNNEANIKQLVHEFVNQL